MRTYDPVMDETSEDSTMTSMEEQELDSILFNLYDKGATQYYRGNVLTGEDEAIKVAKEKLKSLLSQHTQRARVEENEHAKSVWLYEESYFDERLAQLSTKDSTNKEEA